MRTRNKVGVIGRGEVRFGFRVRVVVGVVGSRASFPSRINA